MHIIEDLARQSDKRWAKVLECWRPRLTKRSVPGWERHMTEEMENCERSLHSAVERRQEYVLFAL